MAIAKRNTGVVLPEYEMEHLDTSFKVVLVHSVRQIIGAKGNDEVLIPDQQGLFKVIAHKRALDPVKLSGGDIRYLRRTLEMKAKDLAISLDISPEYLSRCESGEKIMASNAEKMLRLIVLLEPYYMMEKASEEASANIKQSFEKLLNRMEEVRRVVREMKIVSATEIDYEIVYRFRRKKREAISDGKVAAANDDGSDGGEWLKVA